MDARDEVDAIIAQWNRERPGMPTEAMAIFGRLFRVARLLGDAMEMTYQVHGIGRGEFDVLAALRRAGDPFQLSPGRLASTLMLSTGGMTGRLDRLERSGLITRSPAPRDRRALIIGLTARGRELLEAALVAGVELEEQYLAALDEGTRAELDRALVALLAQPPPSGRVPASTEFASRRATTKTELPRRVHDNRARL